MYSCQMKRWIFFDHFKRLQKENNDITWVSCVGSSGKVSAEPIAVLGFVVCCTGKVNLRVRRDGDWICRTVGLSPPSTWVTEQSPMLHLHLGRSKLC